VGDLLARDHERVMKRVGVVNRTKELNLQTYDFFEATWPGFPTLRPEENKPVLRETSRLRELPNESESRRGRGVGGPGPCRLPAFTISIG
jgi:hypothetical protein